VVTGRGPALERLLGDLSSWKGTLLSHTIVGAGAEPGGCEWVEARAPTFDPEALLGALHCVPFVDPALEARREGADLVVILPAGDAHAVVRLRVGDVVDIDAHIPEGVLPPLLEGLQPGSGPGLLSTVDTLFHARFRTTGIAETVGRGGQGERLFALGSSMLVGSILDGSVELAWYAPPPGASIPPLVVALGASSRFAASDGAARYVQSLQERWPLVPRAVRLGDAEGQCLDGLRVLPGFAPCWLATDGALVLSWNEAVLIDALGAGPRGPEDAAVVRLSRFPEADDALRRARGLGDPEVSIHYPWDSLDVRAEVDEGLHVHARLRSEAP
jgi:hypothetical protein